MVSKDCKALKVRIYPNLEQKETIDKTIGSCRFLYNHMLAERIGVFETLKDDRRALYEHKFKTEKEYKSEFEWMKEVDSIALQQSRVDLSIAYQIFFKSTQGARKVKVGFPKFHKKGRKDSYRTVLTLNNIAVDFENRKVKLPKLGLVTFRDSRKEFAGKLKQATVSRSKSGKYFVSVLFEFENEKEIELPKNPKTKGLDCSIKSFFVDETGNSPAYKRLYRDSEKKLKVAQRKLSRKEKGSANRKKAIKRLAIIHEKIANRRKDFTHKLSTELLKHSDIIVVENLNLHAMAQTLNLGKSVNDLGFGMFLQQLQYKAKWQGKLVIEADKWFASSKTCSKCGWKYKDLKLSDRLFQCKGCGFEIDRDQNAGINLRNYGLEKLGLGQPEYKPVEKSTADKGQLQCQVFSMKQEAAKSLASR